MIQSEHVTREELQELLNCEVETERTRGWQNHLQSCESCRKALDQVAARSEIWQKAPELLRGKPDSGQYVDLSSGELETQDVADNGSSAAAESEQAEQQMAFGYPVDTLLEPSHNPKMMGRIGRYDIEREIGRGGMGIVFKAHDSELNRPLAVKVLAPHLANHGPARQRFAQEARAAAAVLHPNVIAVHDVNNEGKTPYIVMPYIAGSSLQTLVVQNGPLAEIEVVRMALQIAAGLTPAHAQGLVHRDIKPSNILVERGVKRVIITDFGLARAEDDASLTKTGWLTGTPNYMSPEQTRGGRLDHRSDLFSLGSLIYFLVTGRLPFRAESPLGVLNRIQNDKPTSVRQVNNPISTTLSQIIDVLLRKEPDRRFQSAGELHDVLEQHLAHLHQPEIAKPPKVIETPPGSWRKSIGITGAIGALILGGWFVASAIPGSNGVWSFFKGQEPQTVVMSFNGEDWPNGTSFQIPPAATGPVAIVNGNVAKESEPAQATFLAANGPDDDGRDDFNAGKDLLADGQFDEAITKFKSAAKSNSYSALATYNMGCCYALKGDRDRAFEYLDGAIKLGFLDAEKLQTDENLNSIRSDTRFQALIESQ